MRYRVKVFRRDSGVTILNVEAAAIGDAERNLRIQGYHTISVSEAKDSIGCLLPRMPRQRVFPVLVFCQELAALTSAGLSLIEAIDALHNRSSDPVAHEVIGRLQVSLREGRSLSLAMSDIEKVFPELLIATIRSSEETGELDKALKRYIDYRQLMDGLRDKVVAASVYPALLLAVGGLVVIFLLGYVVPRFSRVFEGLGDNLPYLSRLLIGWGQFASDNMLGLIVAFVAALILIGHALLRPETRAWLSAAAWHLPLVGEKLRIYQLARFTRTLSMLLAGGIPLVTALGMVKGLLHQPTLQASLDKATRAIREGQSATDAFAQHGLATEVGLKMMAVGERSGELGHMLENLANFYDLENERFIAWSTRLIEPIFMTIIGLVVGVIVLLMYFPIFELAGNLR